MKSNFFISAAVCLLICTTQLFAQSDAVQITGGRFFIKGISNGEEANNAVINTENFSAVSFLGGRYSPWYDICISTPTDCGFGKTITVPRYPRVDLGGCVGDCHQFINGTFTINGVTYQNAYFRGYFDFSQESFLIPKTVRRKGTTTFRKPFTLSGFLQVCSETNIDRNCPADKILFNGAVNGRGTLTATFIVKTTEIARPYPYPYLFQQSFEYQFEP
jgi:hypothetical protein